MGGQIYFNAHPGPTDRAASLTEIYRHAQNLANQGVGYPKTVGIVGVGEVGAAVSHEMAARALEYGGRVKQVFLYGSGSETGAYRIEHVLRDSKVADAKGVLRFQDMTPYPDSIPQVDLLLITAGNDPRTFDRNGMYGANKPVIEAVAQNMKGFLGHTILLTNPPERLAEIYAAVSGQSLDKVYSFMHIDKMRLDAVLRAMFREQGHLLAHTGYVAGTHADPRVVLDDLHVDFGKGLVESPLEITAKGVQAVNEAVRGYGPYQKQLLEKAGLSGSPTAKETATAAHELVNAFTLGGIPVNLGRYRDGKWNGELMVFDGLEGKVSVGASVESPRKVYTSPQILVPNKTRPVPSTEVEMWREISDHVVIPAGRYLVDFDIRVTRDGSLEVQPGAEFYFGQQGGIFSEGVLQIVGTAQKPISFSGQKDGWRNITLLGHDSSSSRLSHVQIRGGRGREREYIHEGNEYEFNFGGGIWVADNNDFLITQSEIALCQSGSASAVYTENSMGVISKNSFNNNRTLETLGSCSTLFFYQSRVTLKGNHFNLNFGPSKVYPDRKFMEVRFKDSTIKGHGLMASLIQKILIGEINMYAFGVPSNFIN